MVKNLILALILFFAGFGSGYLTFHTETKAEQKNTISVNKNSDTRANDGISQKVYEVLAYVRNNEKPMLGYVGGRKFKNFEGHLPKTTVGGKAVNYKEWDVNPKKNNQNRGAERIVTGDDGKNYYTNDHYQTFKQIDIQ